MTFTAFLKNHHSTPRKVRLVGDAVKGKSVEEALLVLSYMPKRAALPLKKLILSALANAKADSKSDLVVKDLRVDKGLVMRRSMPRARGSAAPIRKRFSHVRVILGEKITPTKKSLPESKK